MGGDAIESQLRPTPSEVGEPCVTGRAGTSSGARLVLRMSVGLTARARRPPLCGKAADCLFAVMGLVTSTKTGLKLLEVRSAVSVCGVLGGSGDNVLFLWGY